MLLNNTLPRMALQNLTRISSVLSGVVSPQPKDEGGLAEHVCVFFATPSVQRTQQALKHRIISVFLER